MKPSRRISFPKLPEGVKVRFVKFDIENEEEFKAYSGCRLSKDAAKHLPTYCIVCFLTHNGKRAFGLAMKNPKDSPNDRKGRIIALRRALYHLNTGKARPGFYGTVDENIKAAVF